MPRSGTKKPARRSSSNDGNPKAAIYRSESDRPAGSGNYIRLDDDEKFTGYALFNPDPAAEDNPGYVEYGEHYDNQLGRFIPCWGAKNGCIFCAAGQYASQRALTTFLVDDEVKIFRMNKSTLQEWFDALDEDGPTIGMKVRIKCLDHRNGEYTTKFFDADKLKTKELKEAMKLVPDLEKSVQRSLDSGLEALRVQNVLATVNEDDDDDDDDVEEEETKPKARRGKAAKEAEVVEEDDDDDEATAEVEDIEEEDFEILKVSKKNNSITVEHDDEKIELVGDEDEIDVSDFKKGDTVTVSASYDDDDEAWTLTAIEDASAEASSDDDDDDTTSDDDDETESETITDQTYTIVSVDESASTFTLDDDDVETLYMSQEVADAIDFDDFKKGDKIKVTAEKDADDDWVATSIEKKSRGGAAKDKKKKTASKRK